MFIVVGTSLNVYPAAGLIHYVSSEAKCFLVDPSEVTIPHNYKIINESASTGMKKLLQLLKNN
jgi:NAD-dependent deacetylase